MTYTELVKWLAGCDIVFCVFGYLILFYAYYGFFPTSYSGSYVHWEETPTKKGKILNAGYLFTSWTTFNIYFMMSGILAFSKRWYRYVLGLGAMFYLGVVGARPSGIKKQITKIHCISAKLCALSAVIWVLTFKFYILTFSMMGIGFLFAHFFKKGKYEVLIMEMLAFLLADIAILIL